VTPRLLDALESAGPTAPALRFPGQSLDYAALRDWALALAGELDGAGAVAVWSQPRIETCVGVVAGLIAGVPVIPLNPRSGELELAHILADSKPDVLLAAPDDDLPDALVANTALRVLAVAPPSPVEDRQPEGAKRDSTALPPEPPPAATALIVYTSGTTGPPKGVLLPRRAIASNLDALADAWQWSGRDVVAHGLPLFHVHGLVLGILGPLRLGGLAHHLGRFSPEAVVDAFADGATMLFGVPTMYRRLAQAAEDDPAVAHALAGARLLVSGSAALPVVEHRRLAQLTGQLVVERYGMSETLMNTAVRADGARRAGYVGPPVPGVDLRLVDDDGGLLDVTDDETIGEIEVRGPNLFLGYLNRQDATAEAFRNGWFRTGDLATRDTDGYIRIVGRRATDLIKSGGYKIGAGEIEAALREHWAVEDAAVTAEPDPDLGERVVAWVVCREGATAEPSALSAHVAAMLAPHKRPRVVHFLDELPRNELGKVQKARLRPAGEGPGVSWS
jgi:malonyl-CoA/methylmalonyl-CoA synthetase